MDRREPRENPYFLHSRCVFTPARQDTEGRTTEWRLLIDSLEGIMYAETGDYIIKGVNGELYPCKPDVFAKTYERVEE